MLLNFKKFPGIIQRECKGKKFQAASEVFGKKNAPNPDWAQISCDEAAKKHKPC